MAPTMRAHTQTRRGNRAGYQEHDDFEGLPVRQWRQEWVNIAPPPPVETTQKNDIWAIELPHGMPKDSHLLPTHTQELLRAARSGRLYKRPAPAEEEEADGDAAPEKSDKKEEDLSTKGYMVKVWKQVPRNAEGPTISHLAKRRKGTVTLSAALPVGNPSGPTVTKATVRRIDAAGNPYNQEVILAAGQAVDGEIISTTVVQAPTASANTESAGATPVRRRPPPPKRKAKGPGRGRKKKLPLPGPSIPQVGAPGVVAADGGVKPEGVANDVKQEGGDDNKPQDTEMAEGDDDEDGDDDGDDGDEGDEGDDDDGEGLESEKGTPARKEGSTDHELKHSPSVDPPVISAPLVNPDAMDISTDEPVGAPPQAPAIAAVAPIQPPSLISPIYEGSPLKNVLVPSPTESVPLNLAPVSAAPVVEAATATWPPPPTPAVAAPVPEISELQTSSSLDPLPAPVESVEPIIAQVVESTSQETPAPEPQDHLDTEMTDISQSQPEVIADTKVVTETHTSDGQVVVEEVVDTTNISPNEEIPPEVPIAAEEATSTSEAVPAQSEPETVEAAPPFITTPVIREASSVEKESTPLVAAPEPSDSIMGDAPPVIVQESDQVEQPEQSEQAEQVDEAMDVVQPEQPEQPQQSRPSEQAEQPGQTEQTELPEQSEQTELPEQSEQTELPEQSEQPERPEQPEQLEQPEELEQPQKVTPPAETLPTSVAQITEVTDIASAPSIEIPIAPTEEIVATTLPALNPLQTEATDKAPLDQEREPESPDLLGGLEAVLDRHGETGNEQQENTSQVSAPVVDAPPEQPTAEIVESMASAPVAAEPVASEAIITEPIAIEPAAPEPKLEDKVDEPPQESLTVAEENIEEKIEAEGQAATEEVEVLSETRPEELPEANLQAEDKPEENVEKKPEGELDETAA
ncbi:hypothetical protein PFICI_02947 [Pestalotiopsis fici W106-1]|uniref:Apopolysialoglycoprotein n=1 Tax=Pestalotiopsis fici (strain W106-1 / CGMCC3.15140) TaxID=1229662 RepID=W3XHL0_PESFW|nr:uncharacterized protein PFICI_02947 [Pestalotiopsis fici W106-1]ETS84922.1 hypothetical protein PFICI_02947 [Pestalotiopsis fici W106-1]